MEVTTNFDSDRAEYEYMKEQIEKQAIEEMAKVIERTEQIARDAHCGLPSPTMYAKDLYWHGYRRQIEAEWVAKKEMYRTPSAKNYYCSNCAKSAIFDSFMGVSRITKYCPDCGAHMKGGAE